MESLCQINSTISILLLDIHTFYQYSLPSGRKKKGVGMTCFSLSIYVFIFSNSSLLIQENK